MFFFCLPPFFSCPPRRLTCDWRRWGGTVGEGAVFFSAFSILSSASQRGVAHRWSRWGPIVAISIGPFLLGVLEVLGPFTAGPVTLGDKGWPVVLGVFSSSMVILGLNYTFMSERVVELKDEQAL